uniref:Uncharacterized protein n=1 Tax=Salix viminalis TaxID=40686 RepID=A0A6N2M6N6_SALVM
MLSHTEPPFSTRNQCKNLDSTWQIILSSLVFGKSLIPSPTEYIPYVCPVQLAAAHEQMRSAEEDAAEWKRKYDIAVRETKAALEKVAASSFEKDFQEMQEMLQQLKLEKEKTEALLKEKDEMLKAKDDEIEMKGKEHEKMKSEFQKLEIERLAEIERAQRHVESLYSDWDLLPPKTIKDPEAKKPEIWDDKEYIPDLKTKARRLG